MRNYAFAIAALSLVAITSCCDEVGPNVDLDEDAILDTTYLIPTPSTPQEKAVVLEEFTGVQCSNCPNGHAEIVDLKNAYGERFIALSMHSMTILSDPFPHSTQDLRLQDAQDIADELQVASKPVGAQDRVIFFQTFYCTPPAYWQGYVQQRLNETTPVNISVEPEYDDATSEATITVTVEYTSAVTAKNKLILALLEDSIITPQTQPNNSVLDDYVHMEVLRDIMTSTSGDALQQPTGGYEAGRVFKKVYKRTLDSIWVPKHMKVVAYVMEYQGSKTIYHGAEVHLIP